MSLGKKITVLVLLLGCCIGIGCYAAISHSVFPEFEEFEKAAARESLDRLDRVLDAEVRAFAIMNGEYAVWNDTYKFVLGRDDGYVEENLSTAYWKTLGIDVILIYDRHGELFWGSFTNPAYGDAREFDAQLDRPVAPGHPLLEHNELYDGVAGLLRTRNGPMLVASDAILTTYGEGPKAGSFVVGRYVDASLIDDVSDRASVDGAYHEITADGAGRLGPEGLAALVEREDRRLVERTDDQVIAHRLIRDVLGEPAGVFEVHMPQTITGIGRAAINNAMALIAGVTAVFLVLMVALMRRLVVAPVNRLSARMSEIRRTGDLESTLNEARSDEIGALGREFDDLTTDLHLAQKELEATRDVAIEASRAKSDFLARMSHEIRTPMNGVLGMTELLQNTPMNFEQRRFADSIYSSAENLLEIINDILDFSKIEAGKLQLDIRDINLGAVVEETVDTLASQAQKKGLELLIDVAPAAHTSLKGDSVRLRQILTNLIANAVKFTNRGEVVTRVMLEGEDEKSVTARFEVTDTGIGIKPEKRELIFDSFAQVDGSTTRMYGGTGLGLAICKQLVDLMGGTLEVDSTPGVGSTFSFSLRMDRGEGGSGAAVIPGGRVAGARILVVDDNATNREILEQQLDGWRARCDSAESADAALGLLSESLRNDAPYDLVILDMHMPRVDGLELASRIRAEPGFDDVKLLVLSSVAMPASEDTLVELGIAGQLTKPVRQSQLYDALAVVLNGSALAPPHALPGATTLSELRGRVLLAEDNAVNQAVATGMLRFLGIEADVVTDGGAAVDALNERGYDLVLMDCQMPVMDGLEATREIRRAESAARRERVPIVALTANAMAGDRERCLEAGMDDYLGKPFTQDQLHAVLSLYLACPEADGEAPGRRPAARPDAGAAAGDATAGESAPPALDRAVLAVLDELQQPGSPSLVEKVIGIYLESAPPLRERLDRAIVAKDSAQIRESAHALKSSSTNVGATRLAEICKELERMGRKGNLAGVDSLRKALEAEYVTARDALRAEIEEVAQ